MRSSNPSVVAGTRSPRPLASLSLALLLAGCGTRGPSQQLVPVPEPAETPVAVVGAGLQVTAGHRPESGSVSIHLALPAGSGHETPESAGAAAMLGLVILGGGTPDGLHTQLTALGGEARAWQTVAHAHYAITVPAERVEEALNALAQAVLKPHFDPARLQRLSQSLDAAQARRRALGAVGPLLRVLGLLTESVHPALPGSAALAALDPAALKAFHTRTTVGGGAAVAVVGDVAPDAAKKLVASAFADLPAGHDDPAGRLATPTGAPQVELLNGTRGAITVAWPVAVPDARAAAQLDLLAALLAGPQGRIAERLSRERHPAQVLRAYTWILGGGRGLFVVEARVADPEAAWPLLVAEVVDVGDRPPAAADLAALQAALERLHATREDDPAEEAARRATVAAAFEGGANGGYLDGLRSATAATVSARARPLVAGALAAVVEVAAPKAGDEGAEPPADPALWGERLAEQATAASQSPAPPDVGVLTLAPGFQALIHPMPGARTVTVYAVIEGGQAADPEDQGGVSALVAAALGRGAGDGPPVRVHLYPDHLSLSVTVPPAEMERALDAITERLRGLALTPARIESARALALTPRLNPLAQATALMWSRWAPPRESALQNLTPGPVRAWFDAYVVHAPLRVVLAGAVDPTQAVRALRPLTGGDRRPLTATPLAAVRPDGASAGAEAAPVRRTTDGHEGALLVAWPVPADSTEGLAAADLLAELLVSPDGPLGEAIAAGSLLATVHPMSLASGASQLIGARLVMPADAQAAAIAAVASAADRLARIGPSDEEVAQARARLDGRMVSRLDQTGARAAWLAGHLRAGRPLDAPDALKQYRAELAHVSAAMVGRIARAHLLPEARIQVELVAAQATPVALNDR